MVPPVGRLVSHNRVSSASRMCLSTSVLLLLFDEQYRRLRSSKQVNMVFNAHRNLIGREKGPGKGERVIVEAEEEGGYRYTVIPIIIIK